MVRGGSCEPQGMAPPARAHPAALMEGAGQSGSGSKVQQVHGSMKEVWSQAGESSHGSGRGSPSEGPTAKMGMAMM